MEPGISVIIPVYNTQDYLLQCVDSVLKQIEDVDEVILVDDGSMDNSREICEKYKEKYENITLLRQNNAGLGCARNRGLRKASKEYVIFLDSDDYWEQDTILTLKHGLQKNRPDLLYFDAKCIYDDISLEKKPEFHNSKYCRKGCIPMELLSGPEFFRTSYPEYFNVSACMVVIRREFLTEHGISFPEGIYYEDNLFSFQAVLEAQKVQYIPEQLYVRRYRSDSIMTSGIVRKKLEDRVSVAQEVCEYILRVRSRYSGNILWKMYLFAYNSLNCFLAMKEQYKESADDLSELERNISQVLLLLKKSEKTEENIAAGVFLNLLKDMKDKVYAQELIKECFADDFGPDVSLEQVYCIYLTKYKKAIDEKLKSLPLFQQGARVGIYGAGKYTRSLLKECRKLGNITNDIFIIDSYMESERESFEGYPVINVKDAGTRIDTIIISSFCHERKMLEMTGKFLDKNIPVILLHEDEIGPVSWQHIDERKIGKNVFV